MRSVLQHCLIVNDDSNGTRFGRLELLHIDDCVFKNHDNWFWDSKAQFYLVGSTFRQKLVVARVEVGMNVSSRGRRSSDRRGRVETIALAISTSGHLLSDILSGSVLSLRRVRTTGTSNLTIASGGGGGGKLARVLLGVVVVGSGTDLEEPRGELLKQRREKKRGAKKKLLSKSEHRNMALSVAKSPAAMLR